MIDEETRQENFRLLRNIDRDIAQHVFGWTPVFHEDTQQQTWRVSAISSDFYVYADRNVPYYTLQEREAFLLAKYILHRDETSFGLWRHSGSKEWQAHFGNSAVGDSTLTGGAAEAIARAALAYVLLRQTEKAIAK